MEMTENTANDIRTIKQDIARIKNDMRRTESLVQIHENRISMESSNRLFIAGSGIKIEGNVISVV